MSDQDQPKENPKSPEVHSAMGSVLGIQSDAIAQGFAEVFSIFKPEEKAKINIRATQLFVQLKMVGELKDWPELIHELNFEQSNKLRYIVWSQGALMMQQM